MKTAQSPEQIYNILMNGEHRSVEIYGGAYHLAKKKEFSIDELIVSIVEAIKNAQYFRPELDAGTVSKRFCNLLFVDARLVECATGTKFSEVV